jgi:hypothetical protein
VTPDAPNNRSHSGAIAAVVLSLPLLYVVSFGPACWLTSQVVVGGEVVPHRAMRVYSPLVAVARRTDSKPGACLRWWMTAGLKSGHSAVAPGLGGEVIVDAL